MSTTVGHQDLDLAWMPVNKASIPTVGLMEQKSCIDILPRFPTEVPPGPLVSKRSCTLLVASPWVWMDNRICLPSAQSKPVVWASCIPQGFL